MTRDDLLPLARAFLAQPKAVHRYTNLLDCAAHVFAEALAQPAETGAGMSDRTVGGIHHTPDSPLHGLPSIERRLVPRHMPPVDPTIEAGDPA